MCPWSEGDAPAGNGHPRPFTDEGWDRVRLDPLLALWSEVELASEASRARLEDCLDAVGCVRAGVREAGALLRVGAALLTEPLFLVEEALAGDAFPVDATFLADPPLFAGAARFADRLDGAAAPCLEAAPCFLAGAARLEAPGFVAGAACLEAPGFVAGAACLEAPWFVAGAARLEAPCFVAGAPCLEAAPCFLAGAARMEAPCFVAGAPCWEPVPCLVAAGACLTDPPLAAGAVSSVAAPCSLAGAGALPEGAPRVPSRPAGALLPGRAERSEPRRSACISLTLRNSDRASAAKPAALMIVPALRASHIPRCAFRPRRFPLRPRARRLP